MSAILPNGEIKPRRPDCLAGGPGFEPRLTESESPRRVLVCHASSPAPCSCANTRASGSPSLSFQPGYLWRETAYASLLQFSPPFGTARSGIALQSFDDLPCIVLIVTS